MDSPSWNALLKGVEELGHGTIAIRDEDGIDYGVLGVEVVGDEVVITIEEL